MFIPSSIYSVVLTKIYTSTLSRKEQFEVNNSFKLPEGMDATVAGLTNSESWRGSYQLATLWHHHGIQFQFRGGMYNTVVRTIPPYLREIWPLSIGSARHRSLFDSRLFRSVTSLFGTPNDE